MIKSTMSFKLVVMLGVIFVPPVFCSCSGGASLVLHDQKGATKKMSFPENEFWRKGGVGTIVSGVFVDLTSKKNKLLLADKQAWEGMDSSKAETIIVFNGKVYSQSELPVGFQVSKSVLISFEVSRVYFYDFIAMDGGYYSRDK